ncbi:posphoenolpyruvate synthetase regulatory kinase/phosphorylase PpsR [Flocculibacter collagenilyticus]|uniref:posphoenolpyruvate synthetase regulatory kinase/phosphorylase PpsR n=1 Tax=Flocculibacter collagenilyticus TaxID=2744479 RepID=UPI0018F5F368|nr:pyruvate, water dikinase regulatory protein [Flocculibacter collagenilyticus]
MRTAYFISDGTAITSEVFGNALLSLFPIEFEPITIPFVETTEAATRVQEKINDRYKTTGERPLVFYTFVDPELTTVIRESEGACFDFLNHFAEPMAAELKIEPKPKAHRTHSIHEKTYDNRIEAINYTMANDDGQNLTHFDEADIILVGVSRTGKTPTSLYLAMQYGIKAANYPFIAEDMDSLKLPKVLKENKSKLFGLTINPERLAAIRHERRANSRYASIRQCRIELREVEMLYKKEKIQYINSTHLSVEEITAKILGMTGLERHKY